MGNAWTRYWHPEVMPYMDEEPTFDPMYGFPNGRKERVMIATEEEMRSAKLDLKHRDFCAHKLLDYEGCLRSVWPIPFRCGDLRHEYMHCQYEDYILRMKEFERERRLRERRKRIALKSQNNLEASEE